MSGSRLGRCVVIVQARTGSTRLPGKVLEDLAGETVIERVMERASRARLVDALVVATTDLGGDDGLADLVIAAGRAVYRGSSDDVLSRYVLAARGSEADTIVRITSDCPFVDPGVIDTLLATFDADSSIDYCTNTLVRTFPIGLDVEVCSRDALERAQTCARAPHEREHVTPYIYQHPEEFKLVNVEAEAWARHPPWRLTVDEPADLELARRLFERLPSDFTLRDVIAALEADLTLLDVNAAVDHRYVEKPASW